MALADGRNATTIRSPFTTELEAALNRPLNTEETEFLQGISAAFAEARKNEAMLVEDFEALGFNLPGQARDGVSLRPAIQENERGFWQYVVLHLEERGIRVPGFLKCAALA